MSFFFKSNQAQISYINKKILKIYPDFKTGGYYFENFFLEHANYNSIVLDAGCGNGGMMIKYKNIPQKIIGIDVETTEIDNNQIIDQKIIANLEKTPLPDNSIDVVVSVFVLEHLKNPEKVFIEIKRVLKKDGVFIFITPNILNPIMGLSNILPHFLHIFFRKYVLKKQEETYKTYYKVNTHDSIVFLAEKIGFKKCEIKRAGNPEYVAFCKPFVAPAIYLEKIIDNRILNFLKMYLVGCLTK